MHNVRHSGESRNPEGKGNGEAPQIRALNCPGSSCSKNPLRVLCITIRSVGKVVRLGMNRPCPAPLDSGFRRNDGRCAKYPLREAKKARASEVMLSWDFMEPRISFITLGVDDLPRSVEFYRDGLGLPLFDENTESIAFFRTEGTWLALYPRAALADDVGIDTEGSGFSGVTLAHNVRSREEVDTMLAVAVAAGAKLVKPAEDVFWGGYSGYFSDPDGYLWEIAWNPHFWIE